ncbi:hypothetical protein RUND412_002433 [Rhizina undulata]
MNKPPAQKSSDVSEAEDDISPHDRKFWKKNKKSLVENDIIEEWREHEAVLDKETTATKEKLEQSMALDEQQHNEHMGIFNSLTQTLQAQTAVLQQLANVVSEMGAQKHTTPVESRFPWPYKTMPNHQISKCQVISIVTETMLGATVEIILYMLTLFKFKDQYQVIQAALLGSILANLLLCTRLCFIIGGIRSRDQEFNETVVETSGRLLLLSVVGLTLPAAFYKSTSAELTETELDHGLLRISRVTGCLCLISYTLYWHDHKSSWMVITWHRSFLFGSLNWGRWGDGGEIDNGGAEAVHGSVHNFRELWGSETGANDTKLSLVSNLLDLWNGAAKGRNGGAFPDKNLNPERTLEIPPTPGQETPLDCARQLIIRELELTVIAMFPEKINE